MRTLNPDRDLRLRGSYPMLTRRWDSSCRDIIENVRRTGRVETYEVVASNYDNNGDRIIQTPQRIKALKVTKERHRRTRWLKWCKENNLDPLAMDYWYAVEL